MKLNRLLLLVAVTAGKGIKNRICFEISQKPTLTKGTLAARYPNLMKLCQGQKMNDFNAVIIMNMKNLTLL